MDFTKIQKTINTLFATVVGDVVSVGFDNIEDEKIAPFQQFIEKKLQCSVVYLKDDSSRLHTYTCTPNPHVEVVEVAAEALAPSPRAPVQRDVATRAPAARASEPDEVKTVQILSTNLSRINAKLGTSIKGCRPLPGGVINIKIKSSHEEKIQEWIINNSSESRGRTETRSDDAPVSTGSERSSSASKRRHRSKSRNRERKSAGGGGGGGGGGCVSASATPSPSSILAPSAGIGLRSVPVPAPVSEDPQIAVLLKQLNDLKIVELENKLVEAKKLPISIENLELQVSILKAIDGLKSGSA